MHIDRTTVDFEDFGDEIVFINVKNGSYFSLKGKAIEVFRVLARPCSRDEILSLVSSEYEPEERQRILQVIQTFEAQGLFVESVGAAESEWRRDPQLGPTEFVEHHDMQDLIKLDPIHEVSETGWPNVKLEE